MTATEALRASAVDLQRRAEEHQRLMFAAIEGGEIKNLPDTCSFIDCPHKQKLKDTLLEAIRVLEDTRKAFKSRQLEVLRNKLMGVLAEGA